ncbi:hypothetical protein E2C01_066576 [Portunus trituberculatus]|uniref:Uncharacterized protein n=1 Tax=Portunus trituberculatus TaxID=210409 RepID=A0A5B7HSP7_PORTR|nr:hypothetical protein [Portunus trituberculatus]
MPLLQWFAIQRFLMHLSDAKKTDHWLQDVSKDILWAATIVTESLLALDKVAQDADLPEVAREVGVLNRALALLGNANYKNNLARRFTMKHEINHKYVHLCSSKVPSAKQIVDSEKLKNKFIAKKLTSTWSFKGDQNKRSFSRYQPYGQLRHGAKGAQQHYISCQDSVPKKRQEQGPAPAPAAVEASKVFEAGRLHYFINEWRKITNDPAILDIVTGCHLDIKVDEINNLFSGELEYIFNDTESHIISEEIDRLLKLKVIQVMQRMKGQVISPIFFETKEEW